MSMALHCRLIASTIAITVVVPLAWSCYFDYQGRRLQAIDRPDRIAWNFTHMDWLLNTIRILRSDEIFPLAQKPKAKGDAPSDVVMFLDTFFIFNHHQKSIREWIEATGMVVVAGNEGEFEQYYQGKCVESQAICWSVAKSFVSALVGFAAVDGNIRLQGPVDKHVLLLKNSGYRDVPILDVLEMSASIDFSEGYAAPDSGISQLGKQIFFDRSTNKWIGRKVIHSHWRLREVHLYQTYVPGGNREKLDLYSLQSRWRTDGVRVHRSISRDCPADGSRTAPIDSAAAMLMDVGRIDSLKATSPRKAC